MNDFPPVIKDILPEASPHCSSNATAATAPDWLSAAFGKSSVRDDDDRLRLNG
jgi:hypothetical protein